MKSIKYGVIYFDRMFFTIEGANQYWETMVYKKKFKPVKIYISETDPRKSPKMP